MSRTAHYWLRGLALALAALAVVLALTGRDDTSGNIPDTYSASEIGSAPADALSGLPPLFAQSVAPIPVGVAESGLELIGVIGRLPDDAEVLVRKPDGGSATVRVGGSVLGWTLVAVAADRAEFEQAGQRQVLTMPTD